MHLGQLLGFTAALLATPGSPSSQQLSVNIEGGTFEAWAVAPDVLRVDFVPTGVSDGPTVVLDPKGLRRAKPCGQVTDGILTTSAMRVIADGSGLRIADLQGHRWVTVPLPGKDLAFTVRHASNENLYGMRSYSVNGGRGRPNPSQGLLRNSGSPVAAGAQGDGGAPIAYTTHWGMLVDSVDGAFTNEGGDLTFQKGSRKSIEAYVVLGEPKRTIAAITALSGRPPMPPKWSLGFMNSEWGTTQKEVEQIVAEYRRREIPLDAFILDFDFKAWGEDNYGEFRWNSTNGPGAVEGNKYPDGASGKFAKEMDALGVKLVGIMKPRVLTKNTKGETTAAAKDIDAHHWWLPNHKPYDEYFSHRPANDLDFSSEGARKWYWTHAEPLFETGIVGWWNDEADENYSSLGHFQMQQSLYEGQRSVSDLRVFSLNRNFYLGAQRYGFGVWSGDISNGFNVMAAQRARMLTMVGLAEPHWSMDTGGFQGHPASDVYARWMQFASVVPIMRVHGTSSEQRQPWVYGPVAEAAAKNAINFRYSMLPSLYSWEREAHETGVGIVRPMHWEFPDDPECANRIDEWMLGGQMLVSPIVDDKPTHSVYLPAGNWFDLDKATWVVGNQTIVQKTDQTNWRDLPRFVRQGSILATQLPEAFVGKTKVSRVILDVYPHPDRVAAFTVYEDDGSTYAYEGGRYFSQPVTAAYDEAGRVHLVFGKSLGGLKSPFESYDIRIHVPKGTDLNRKVVEADGRAKEIVMESGGK